MSVDGYIAARADFVRVDKEITDLASGIVEIGNTIARSRARFSFSNSEPGLPIEAIMSRDSISANGDRWPSAEQIMDALARWHKARSLVDSAWHALNKDQQSALQPPPR